MVIRLINQFRPVIPHLSLIIDDFVAALKHYSQGGREYLMTFIRTFQEEQPEFYREILRIKNNVAMVSKLVLTLIIWFGEIKLGMIPVRQ